MCCDVPEMTYLGQMKMGDAKLWHNRNAGLENARPKVLGGKYGKS